MRHKDFDLCAVLILATMIVPRIMITTKHSLERLIIMLSFVQWTALYIISIVIEKDELQL